MLRPIRRLGDGPYLAKIYPGDADRRRDRCGPLIRFIEYTHDDPNRPGSGERHRLITDPTDPEGMPDGEAPMVYHERWEEELALDQVKTHLSGRAVPIRSKAPAGVVQEVYGLVLAHYVIRRVMHDAAVVASCDPDRLSFIDSLRVLQCRLPESPAAKVEAWYRGLLREVRRRVLRPRQDRWYPRAIMRKMSNRKEARAPRPAAPDHNPFARP